MGRISQNAYYTDFPLFCPKKGLEYGLRYRVLSRRFHLTKNGQHLGAFRHSDLAILAVLKDLTGFGGDEVPKKYHSLLNRIAKGFCLTFQGIGDFEPSELSLRLGRIGRE